MLMWPIVPRSPSSKITPRHLRPCRPSSRAVSTRHICGRAVRVHELCRHGMIWKMTGRMGELDEVRNGRGGRRAACETRAGGRATTAAVVSCVNFCIGSREPCWQYPRWHASAATTPAASPECTSSFDAAPIIERGRSAYWKTDISASTCCLNVYC
jgi:hypothetical protein